MGADSKIEWTTHTFNPWLGCQKVSPACDFCYAETWAERFGQVKWGPGEDRRRTSASNWQQPLKWAKAARDSGTRPRVFCASLADVFDNQVPGRWRDDLWHLINETPELDWLLLTKRPQNVAKMLPDPRTGTPPWDGGWPNVIFGTTIEAEKYLPRLGQLLGAIGDLSRCFVSYEPALGPLGKLHDCWRPGDRPRLLTVICGGESGRHARPMQPAWARDARDQCQALGIGFFMKQWGEWAPYDRGRIDSALLVAPDATERPIQRFGKKLAGRVLDGREWSEFPS